MHNSHTIGVGGWVVRPADGAVLLVRMAYGPANGRLMMPGGHADDGELLEQTAVREVAEETGVTAHVDRLLLVRQRLLESQPNLYFVFLMTPPAEVVLRPQLGEVHEARWVPREELLTRDDLQPIARELARAWLAGAPGLGSVEVAWQNPGIYRVWV
ncbi:MAG: NUDIX hydrolase [Fimbriimonadaceae bacterium]|nr:NUDIX hydrolase [Fimbriimonadaceae bacterium]